MIRLFIRDNDTNYVHEIGTDVHDSLILIDGAIHYYNLQNGCGSLGGTYSFCNEDGTYVEMAHEIYDATRYIVIGNRNFTERKYK